MFRRAQGLALIYLLPAYYLDKQKYADRSQAGMLNAAMKRSRRKFWKLVLFTMFLLYPGVSSSVLSIFVCKVRSPVCPCLFASLSSACHNVAHSSPCRM